MNYFLGLDNGGTLTKAVLFNQNGEEITSSARELKMITPQEGFTERDMDELWAENIAVISDVVKSASAQGINPDDIKAVACSGHGKGLYLWGKAGKPCYNGIVSTDARAWEYPLKWQNDGTADKVFEKTYQRILASQPPSILNWFKDNKPEIIGNIEWIFEVKDYIRFRLTGEAFAEVTDYSGSGLMNIRDKCFDVDLLELYGLADLYDALPPLRRSTDLCGRITKSVSEQTGLAEGTAVAGGMFDIDACAIAMDITNGDNIAVIAGTWGIHEYISKTPVLDGTVMANTLYCMDDYYLIEESSPTSAGNLSWFADMFLEHEKSEAKARGISVYEYVTELAGSVAPNEQDIIFLPYIFGSNYNPKAKACLIGMDSHHERKHIMRAVLEGVAFCHRVHLEKLLAHRTSTNAIRLAGGAAKSDLWVQIFADIFKLPIEIIETNELGALGCAMVGAVACGVYADIESAAKNMVKIKKKVEPNAANFEMYDKKFELYEKVSKALY
ncbi:MAG: carbohydrate kinase [Oscillospiraceae bacterium]|nr:carbohydrate kinase [Oscillospiraceae bacterium]